MLDQCTIKERWVGVNDIIDRWLQQRQNLIVQFCALSGVHELKSEAERSNLRLQNFCQLLVDYVSSGHFEVYYQLIREAEEFKDGSAELAKSLIPQITDSTELALAFNDKYIGIDKSPSCLPRSLSTLGENLEARFELEDRLIDALHEAHRALVA
jgi:regulator of sigma D